MHLSYENQRAFDHILLWFSLFNISVPETKILFCNIHNFFFPSRIFYLDKNKNCKICLQLLRYFLCYFQKTQTQTTTTKKPKHTKKPQQKNPTPRRPSLTKREKIKSNKTPINQPYMIPNFYISPPI